MKRNISGAIAAVLLAAAMVAAGMLVPRLTLEAQRGELLSRSGAVEAKSLTPYGIDRESLSRRIASLAELADAVTSGVGRDKLFRIDARQPLDTELSANDAIDSARKLLSEINTNSENFGFLPFNSSSTYAMDYDESIPPDYDYTPTFSDNNADAALLTAYDDPALSLWLVYIENSYVVYLDALSGLPLYVMVYGPFEYTMLSDEPGNLLYVVSVLSVNALYGDRLSFPLEPDGVTEQNDKLKTAIILSGKDPNGFLMEISITYDADSFITSCTIKIKTVSDTN